MQVSSKDRDQNEHNKPTSKLTIHEDEIEDPAYLRDKVLSDNRIIDGGSASGNLVLTILADPC